MILERVLWLPSTLPVTFSLRMKEDRKRMKAFGGRGMYDASRRLAWVRVVVGVATQVSGSGVLVMLTSSGALTKRVLDDADGGAASFELPENGVISVKKV